MADVLRLRGRLPQGFAEELRYFHGAILLCLSCAAFFLAEERFVVGVDDDSSERDEQADGQRRQRDYHLDDVQWQVKYAFHDELHYRWWMGIFLWGKGGLGPPFCSGVHSPFYGLILMA